MPESQSSENEFITQLTKTVEANLTNPQFGVSMLAKEMGMSRSNLHRKVNAELKISVSQFINHVRLKKAKDILRHTSDTVSEVAYKVGFSNVSYFIKRFHEYYGYSPGEVGNREEETEEPVHPGQRKNQLRTIIIAVLSVVLIAVVLILVFKPLPFQRKKPEVKIAILPPEIWETVDTIQIYGILQSVRDNLGKIKDIKKVTPRLSVQQYKNTSEPAPKISRELGVTYLVEPRIWVNDVRVILSLNLIEGPGDKDLGTFEHPIDSNNITTVHLDILKDITDELDISVTKAEQSRIDKVITSNKKANNFYWKGIEYLNRPRGKKSELEEAKSCFEKALDHDSECAAAYAQLARTYFDMDYHWSDGSTPMYEILYAKEINKYADKAYRIDPQSDLSLIAKALYYRNVKDYEMAIDYLEEALEYNPNSYLAISHLYTMYRQHTENKEKSVEYALKIINSNLPLESTNKELGIELIYKQLSNQYRLLGFPDKALMYINEAIRINPNYTSASYTKSEVIADLEGNYLKSKDILERAINKDSTSIFFLSRLGQWYYMLRDYPNAHRFYKKWFELSGNNAEDYYGLQSRRLAFVYREMGEPEIAQMQINNYREFSESRKEAGRSFQLAGFYSFMNDTANAIEQLKITSRHDHFYYQIRQIRDEPLYDNIRDLPEFQKILSEMQTRWEERHDSLRIEFKKKGLLKIEI